MTMQRKVITSSAAAAFLVLAGCGGSSGGGGDDTDTTLDRSGQAIDGYLVDAAVCVDVNLNAVCDDGEPSATSSDEGQWDISGFDNRFANAPTLVRATAGQTTDTDIGGTISESFRLKAPASAKVVTPITTLVQQRAQSALVDGTAADVAEAVANAKASVESDLGSGVSGVDILNDDYVAAQASDDSATQTAAKKLATTSRALNTVILDTIRRINSNLSDADKTNLDSNGTVEAAILNVAATKSGGNLSSISSDVSSAIDSGGEDADLDQIASDASSNNVVTGAYSNIESELSQEVSDIETAEDTLVEEEETGATGGTGG